MKKVVVIGLGSFGGNLVKALWEKKDIEIIAIDVEESKVKAVKDMVTKPVEMDATVKENLVSAGISDVDYVVVSPGPALEPSILMVHILKGIGVSRIIAKTMSEEHEKILRLVGATDIIFPERDVAEKLASQIDAPNLIDYVPLMSGYVIQEIAPPEAFLGKTLIEIDFRKKYRVTVLAIKSIIPDDIIINPGGEEIVKESDILIVFGEVEDIKNLHKKTNR